MSYNLNKTDGSLLVELVDGRLDTSTTDLSLIGKNYKGFGEFLNENFIVLLENFANTAPPSKPIRGQVWYDTAEGRLKVYDGTTFKSTDSTIFSSSQPTNLTQGDIWIDGTNNQMYFWDGTQLVLVGPNFSKTQTRSGNDIVTIKDTTGQNRIVVRFFIGGSLVGIYSRTAFTPFPIISGFTDLKIGFNISSAFSDFAWHGKADSAEALVDNLGNTYTKDSFLSATENDTTSGKLTIANNSGIEIFADEPLTITKESTITVLRNTGTNRNLFVKLKNTAGEYMGARFDAANKRLGLFKEAAPDYTLDVNGDVRVSGDLIIEGSTTTIATQNLLVQDKQIELSIQDGSTVLSDLDLDDSGIVVRSGPVDHTDRSKFWTWKNNTQSWTSNQGIDISNDTETYKINGVDVLSKDSLGSTIINSNIQTLGTLSELTIDDININGNRISISSGFEIAATGDIELVNSQFITNVKKPVSAFDVVQNPGLTASDDNYASTKGYVDREIKAATTFLTMDTTGMGTAAVGTLSGGGAPGTLEQSIRALLLTFIPLPQSKVQGAVVRILSSQISATTDPINVNSALNKSFIAVDSAGVQNVSVLQDLSISPNPTTTVTFTVTKHIIEFKHVSSEWAWQSTAVYP
jgi:hypothetical protein